MKAEFAPVGNQGCRLWWGKPGTLRARDLGVWHGHWLMGVNGPRRGRFELAFEKWCGTNGHACVRTVDLFWVFQYHRDGFPSRLDERPIRESWLRERALRNQAPRMVKEGRIFVLGRHPKVLSRTELSRYLDHWFPNPGPWSVYYSKKRAYFLEEKTRYRRVIGFWKQSAKLRKMFLRCAAYSNRRPETHPDYLVLFTTVGGLVCAFVEVKSPKEALRPSQRRFFPELVREAGQRVMLVRLMENGENVRFFEFGQGGDLLPCSAPAASPRSDRNKIKKPKPGQKADS